MKKFAEILSIILTLTLILWFSLSMPFVVGMILYFIFHLPILDSCLLAFFITYGLFVLDISLIAYSSDYPESTIK